MRPEDVDGELVDDAVDAWHEMPRPALLDDQMRHILAAVLPRYTAQLQDEHADDARPSPKRATVLARFLTIGGATVEIAQADDGLNRAAHCHGCNAEHETHSIRTYYAEEKSNIWAQGHAETCRAMPVER